MLGSFTNPANSNPKFNTLQNPKFNTLQSLIDFENVLSLEPKNYLGDDFSRVTQIFRVTQYNIACCYSMLGQEESGLEALNAALASGGCLDLALIAHMHSFLGFLPAVHRQLPHSA